MLKLYISIFPARFCQEIFLNKTGHLLSQGEAKHSIFAMLSGITEKCSFLCLQVPYRIAHHLLPIAPQGILEILLISDVVLKNMLWFVNFKTRM